MDAQAMTAGWMLAALVAGVVVLVVGVLAGGAVMRLVMRWIGKQQIGFGIACGAVLVAGALCWVANLALALGLARFAPEVAAYLLNGTGRFAYLAVALVLDVAMVALAVFLVLRGGDGARLPPLRVLGVAATFVAGCLVLFALPIALLAGLFALLR